MPDHLPAPFPAKDWSPERLVRALLAEQRVSVREAGTTLERRRARRGERQLHRSLHALLKGRPA